MDTRLPEYITGNYAVGTECFSMTDSGREDTLGNGGKRKIAVRMYYPCEKAAAAGLTRAEVFTPRKLEAFKKAFHVKELPRELLTADFYENAPHAEGKFPLVLFSCGYNSYVEANTLLCCELASNGFIVASVGHANEAVANEYDDGSYDLFDRKKIGKQMYTNTLFALVSQMRLLKAKITEHEAAERFDQFQRKYTPYIMGRVEEWAKDMLFALADLKTRYAQWADFSIGVGAGGHSLGGAVAYYLCHHSDEVVCGINIDGAVFGDYNGLTMKKPFLQICCKENYNVETRALLGSDAPVECEVFDDMKHIGFTDAKFFVPSKMLVGSMDSEQMYKRLSGSVLGFLKEYL